MIPFERHPKNPHDGRFSRDSARVVERSLGIGAQQPCLPNPRTRASSETMRASWLIGPMLLLAVVAGASIVMGGVDGIFGILCGALIGLGIGWILISALLPGKADRTCPSCGRKGLERLDPNSTCGLTCRFCEWSDSWASSFLLAEEEGPFEDVVLNERLNERGSRPGGGDSF